MSSLADRLRDPRPMLLDGAFGTRLFARGVELPNSSLANKTHPEAVVEVHGEYIEAGSDLIETNTFVASPLHLEMAKAGDVDAAELVSLAVGHARRAAEESGREVFVVGSVGPSPGAIEADTGDPEFSIPDARARDAHECIMAALAEAGVDGFAIETMFSAKEAALAVHVARQFGLPIAVSLTYKYTADSNTGHVVYRTDWGHSPADLVAVLSSGQMSEGCDLLPSVDLFGLNCGAEPKRVEHTGMSYAISGTTQIREALAAASVEGKLTMAYPNAGLPALDLETGKTVFPHTPQEMARHLPQLLEAGAFIVGGCCGTGPEHIRAFRQVLDGGDLT